MGAGTALIAAAHGRQAISATYYMWNCQTATGRPSEPHEPNHRRSPSKSVAAQGKERKRRKRCWIIQTDRVAELNMYQTLLRSNVILLDGLRALGATSTIARCCAYCVQPRGTIAVDHATLASSVVG